MAWTEQEMAEGFFELPESSQTTTNQNRVNQLKSAKKAASNNVNSTYNDMVNQSDAFYQAQIDASKEYAETQSQIQQEQTDFAIEQIEQQKEQAEKDYKKEQSGAYVDWQKQSNEYGANAEQMAAQGMTNTGYSESSQVSLYNTYQNRLATARESYNQAVLNYNNAIKDAQLQNNAALAEIAYNALQTQLELSLEGFQYKNSLIQEQTKLNLEIDNEYHSRYMDVLDQINTENALAEEVRQFNEKLAEEKRQYDTSLAEEKRQYNSTLALQQAQISKDSSGGGSSGKTSTGAVSRKSSKDNSAYYSMQKDKVAAANNLTVDTASIKKLGLGNLTSTQLNNYIKMGIVTEYRSNGKLTYKLSPAGLKYKNLHYNS